MTVTLRGAAVHYTAVAVTHSTPYSLYGLAEDLWIYYC